MVGWKRKECERKVERVERKEEIGKRRERM